MSIVLIGSTSGSCTLQEQAVAGSSVLTLPVGTGTAVVNGVNGSIVSGTAVASTSGTSIDFTSIPSWVKRITVMLNGVSTNGTSNYMTQLIDSTTVTSGYSNIMTTLISGVSLSTHTNGFNFTSPSGTGAVCNGHCVITKISGNNWVFTSSIGDTGSRVTFSQGSLGLSSDLTGVRITTAGGTDTFDAGSINILYE